MAKISPSRKQQKIVFLFFFIQCKVSFRPVEHTSISRDKMHKRFPKAGRRLRCISTVRRTGRKPQVAILALIQGHALHTAHWGGSVWLLTLLFLPTSHSTLIRVQLFSKHHVDDTYPSCHFTFVCVIIGQKLVSPSSLDDKLLENISCVCLLPIWSAVLGTQQTFSGISKWVSELTNEGSNWTVNQRVPDWRKAFSF